MRLPTLPRPDVLVTLAAALAALEGVVALGGGLGLAVGQVTGRFAIERQIDVATPIVLAVVAGFLLQASEALRRKRPERTLFNHTSIAVTGLAQLAVGVPLVWLTVTDPVDARTNVVVLLVASVLILGTVVIAIEEVPAAD